MTDTDYNAIIEKIAEKYSPRAMALLKRIRERLEMEGLTCHNPFKMFDDYYRWSMMVHRHEGDHADEDGVDITVEIAEERDYDDSEGFGINFGMDIVEYGGIILGGMQPYNYTPQVWVPATDPLAVEARWMLIEDADYSHLADMICKGWEWDEDGYYKGGRS